MDPEDVSWLDKDAEDNAPQIKTVRMQKVPRISQHDVDGLDMDGAMVRIWNITYLSNAKLLTELPYRVVRLENPLINCRLRASSGSPRRISRAMLVHRARLGAQQ